MKKSNKLLKNARYHSLGQPAARFAQVGCPLAKRYMQIGNVV